MNPSRPDIVLDCNIYLQAITRRTGPAAVLRLVDRNVVTLHVSRAILRELRATLAYPEIREKNPEISDDVVAAFISHVAFRGVVTRDVPHAMDFPRDPDDEPYIDLAAAVSADYLVTRDQDLLSLMSDQSVEAKQFRQRFPQLAVVNPVEFLDELRRTLPDALKLGE